MMKKPQIHTSIHSAIKAHTLAAVLGWGVAVSAFSIDAAPADASFSLMDMLGKAHYVEHTPEQALAQLKGKKIIGLYFTAKWCSPCRLFSPRLVEFRNAHQDEFQFVMMSWDKSLKEQQAYLARDKMNVPAVRFDDELIREVGSQFGVDGVPTLLIFDSDGHFITGEGRAHLTLAMDPSDLEFLNASAGGKAWHELMAPHQKEALAQRQAELAELVPVVEEHKDFPQLQELFAIQGFYGKDRETDRLMTQIGKDIAADWDQKQGFVDELVVLASEFKPNRKGYRGLFEARSGPCFDELGKHAVENPEIYAKLESLLESGPHYAKQWGLRGIVNAAVAGNEEAFAKVADCESLFANAQLDIFPALKSSCDEGNARALELALEVYSKNTYYIYAAIPVFVNPAYAGNETALDAMAEFCRSGKEDYVTGAMSVLEKVADDGSAHARELLQRLNDESSKASSDPAAKQGARQPEGV